MLELFLKGGPLMWPILACSVLAVAISLHKIRQFMVIAAQVSVPTEEIARIRPRVFEPILAAIDARETEREITLTGTWQVRTLGRGLGLLALISVISPLLGLTGTVTGMIQAFQTIAGQSGQVEVALLAGGIWQALLTTAAGLLVAIPIHVAHHFLDSKLDDITTAMTRHATALLARRSREI